MESDSKLEFDINELLVDIKEVDIKTTEDIHNRNNEILDLVFSKFLKYDKNVENKRITKEKILNLEYEYVEDISDLKPRDSCFGINLNEFYDLKLNYLGFFIKKEDNFMSFLKLLKYRIVHKINCENLLLFRKLNSKDKVQLLLLDSLKKMNN